MLPEEKMAKKDLKNLNSKRRDAKKKKEIDLGEKIDLDKLKSVHLKTKIRRDMKKQKLKEINLEKLNEVMRNKKRREKRIKLAFWKGVERLFGILSAKTTVLEVINKRSVRRLQDNTIEHDLSIVSRNTRKAINELKREKGKSS
jgi:hypothetical protein